MKKGLAELVFILDRSGSMSGLEKDTIGGYNSMIKKQKDEPGEAFVTTVLFDDEVKLLHDRININGIKPMTDKEYYVSGTTALLDAIGKSINKIVNVMRNTDEEEQPEKVLFVITTDGAENASKEYDYNKIKQMIKHQQEKYNWEFIFIGANIDAISEAKRFGIDEERAVNYNADSEGTKLNYKVMSEAITMFRQNDKIDKNWKADIEEDFKNRKRQ